MTESESKYDESETRGRCCTTTEAATESILPSAQIEKFYSFCDRKNEKKLSSRTVMVDFYGLLRRRRRRRQSSSPKSDNLNINNNRLQTEKKEEKKEEPESVISTISNQDLFHAVIGLYDACLPDMTLDVINETICTKQAKTIIVLRDLKETLCEIETKRKQASSVQQCETLDCQFIKDLSSDSSSSTETASGNLDVNQQEKTSPAAAEGQICNVNSCGGKRACDDFVESLLDSRNEFFANIFNGSDEETKDNNGEDEEEEEESRDFSAGIHKFKKDILLRKHVQNQHRHFQRQHIGVEDRIIACATHIKVSVESKDRIVQLTLLAVKRKWRKMGVGKYIVAKLTQPSVVGCYDAVVVHADYSAMDFFKRLGFTDDYLLNSRWNSLCAQFTDCVLMTYIPAFTIPGICMSLKSDNEFAEMEEEFTLWKLKSLSAYQAQVTCLHRMKNEVLQLKSMVDLQHQLIMKLVGENEQLSQQEDNIMSFKQKYATTPNQTTDSSETSNSEGKVGKLSRHECPDGNILTTLGNNTFITFRPSKVKKSYSPDFQHIFNSLTDVIRKFKNDMENDARQIEYNITCAITAINKASVIDQRCHFNQIAEIKIQEERNTRLSPYSSLARDRMYFCSHQTITTENLQEILEKGFTNEDFSKGDFGEGLLFCKSPFTAAHFSVPGKLLLAEVQLGRIKCDQRMPSAEEKSQWGSLLITAPLEIPPSKNGKNRNFLEEYLVLKAEQAVPLCLIEYDTSRPITDHKTEK